MHEFSEFNLSELLFNNFEVFYLICFVGGVFEMAFFSEALIFIPIPLIKIKIKCQIT
jgi:hypothetical protein